MLTMMQEEGSEESEEEEEETEEEAPLSGTQIFPRDQQQRCVGIAGTGVGRWRLEVLSHAGGVGTGVTGEWVICWLAAASSSACVPLLPSFPLKNMRIPASFLISASCSGIVAPAAGILLWNLCLQHPAPEPCFSPAAGIMLQLLQSC